MPHIHPALSLLYLAAQPDTAATSQTGLPPALQRMVVGLRALGKPTTLTDLPLGPWCALLPLWGNPLIPVRCPSQAASPARPGWLGINHARLPSPSPRLPTLSTLRSLHSLAAPPAPLLTLQPTASATLLAAATAVHVSLATSLRQEPGSLETYVQQLWLAVPPDLRALVQATPAPDLNLPEQGVVHSLLVHLGWRTSNNNGTKPGTPIRLLGSTPSVKTITNVIRIPAHNLRASCRLQYVTHAITSGTWARMPDNHNVLTPPSPHPSLFPTSHPPHEFLPAANALAKCMDRHIWHLHWGNYQKEILWRLAVNGVPGAGGYDICPKDACPCGWRLDDADRVTPLACKVRGAPDLRLHAFWSCPVAQAVVAELLHALPASVGLHTSHVWLLLSPCPSHILPVLWHVVCLAALSAMLHGRRYMWALHAQGHHDPRTGAMPQCVHKAKQKAAADFWCRLQDFVDTQSADSHPSPFAKFPIIPNHPFLCTKPHPSLPTSPVLCLNMPAQAPALLLTDLISEAIS
jgi:hypothetical protein